MESAELLDLLGNDTRRRILSLLAQKPCYVTEISEVTGVSPKAVIDHLQRLEEAGLIEYRFADDRRKYFSIIQSQRLEITIAPHEFGTKNGYLPSESIESHTFDRLEVETNVGDGGDDLLNQIDAINELEEVAAELSCAQRFIHGELNRRYQELLGDLFNNDGARLGLDIVELLREDTATVDDMSHHFSVPSPAVQRCIDQLDDADLVEETPDGWTLTA